MVKYLYKGVVLLVVFIGALFFFVSRLESNIYEEGTEVEQGEESLPYLTLSSQGVTLNRLYGYNGPIEDDVVRESITPLDGSREIRVKVTDGEVRLVKLQYKIVDKDSCEVLAESEMNSLDQKAKDIAITLDYGFRTSTEYILSLTATTNSGRKVHYFTRLKYYVENSYLKEKLNFAMKFHEDTFQKTKAEELERYLEPDGTAVNDTLADVTIKSDSDLVTWGKLSPKKISDIVPTIKEYNMETACFHLNYFVEGTTSSGKETYQVNEFYRVRYASGNSYLLNFERKLEAVFDVSLTSVQKAQIKIGITNDTDMDIMVCDGTKKLFFARGGDLYAYDMSREKNTITKLYSAFSEKAPYEYRQGAGQGIRLLRTNEEGDLYFVVYGYFPRGQYEGKVAIVLYQYREEEQSVNELVYLPMDTTYQQLKQDFSDYGYVSERGAYYFSVADVVYSYNMQSRRLTRIAENVNRDSFRVMEKSHCFVWSDSAETGYGDNLTLFDLETEEKTVLSSLSEDEYIRLLGIINDNVIYGYVKKDDVTTTADGLPLVPCYKIIIANSKGEVLKVYEESNKYVSQVEVQGNVMTLKRVKKLKKKRFQEIRDDSILNQMEEKGSAYALRSRVTSGALTEWYIGFPSSFTLERVPEYKKGPEMIVSGGCSIHLDEPEVPKYYVYALGEITAAFEDPVQAIAQADAQMGVVVSGSRKVVWERSGSFLMNSIAGLEMEKASGGVSNLAACAYMVLKANHYSVKAQILSKKKSVYEMLGQYMEEPVNLTGATLEQVLYFVSSNKYVVAMTGNSTAVVISGYDTKNITVFNPANGEISTVGREQFEREMQAAGNRFVSYLN